MFLLERVLRGLLSEAAQERTGQLFSQYNELLGKIKEFRCNKRSSEFHERLRLIVWPYLIKSMNKMEASRYAADDIKIFLLARDYFILIKDDGVDWIGIVKNLMEAKEFGLIVRVLRYLNLEKADLTGNISLLLLNTLNKMLCDAESSLMDISFVFQVIKLFNFNFNEIDGEEMIKKSLLKLLRSDRLNDRLKAMIVQICDDQVVEMLSEENLKSAVIRAALTERGIENSGNIQNSSSKMINFMNGNYEKFSEIERIILEKKNVTKIKSSISSYEKYLLALEDVNINDCEIVDPNVLRILLKIGKILCSDFIKQMPNDLSAVDYELIAAITYDPDLFWKCLNSSEIIPLNGLEIKPYMKDYMMNKDIRSLTLPAQVYFFKLLNNCEDGYDEYLKSVASDLYEKYKDNFDGSGLIFKEFMNKTCK